MARKYIEPVSRYGMHSTPTQTGMEGASVAITLKGAPVIYTAGYLVEAGTNPTTIAGIALEPGHNDGSANTHRIGYCPAIDGVIFEISIDKASGLAGALAVLAQTDVGGDFGITRDSVGIWYLDVDKAGGNQVCNVIDLKDPAGTVQGRCYIRFMRSATFNQ